MKNTMSDFWQRLVIYQKPSFLFKKRKLQGTPAQIMFTIFP